MHELKRLMWTGIREHDHTKHIKICNSNLAIFTQCWNFVIISPQSFGHLSIVKINTEKSSNAYLIFAYNVCETDPCCALLFFQIAPNSARHHQKKTSKFKTCESDWSQRVYRFGHN